MLEKVLLTFRTRDLLFAQRVCRLWKAVTDASPPIQRALFFQPGVAADVSAAADLVLAGYGMPGVPDGRHGPGFYAPCDFEGDRVPQGLAEKLAYAPREGDVVLALNPLLWRSRETHVHADLDTATIQCRTFQTYTGPVPRPSCERMFMTQLPVATAFSVHTRGFPSDPVTANLFVLPANGLFAQPLDEFNGAIDFPFQDTQLLQGWRQLIDRPGTGGNGV